MENKEFKNKIIELYGNFYSEQIDFFFEEAIRLAKEGNYTSAIKVGKDAFILSKYANFTYEKIYLIGLLCHAYLDNKQPEIADVFFKLGMQMIDENDINFNDDINAFLDIKILIDETLT